MHYLAIVKHLRVQDVVDILFLAGVVYYLYKWFRGTKAFKALVGLLALGVIYTIARAWGLFLTTWVFQILWQVLVILLIILFQSEIRQVLERVNPLRIIGFHALSGPTGWVTGFVQAIFLMAKRRIGALIILERGDRTEEWTTACIPLQGEPSPEILLSIFQKDSPLHDGAVLIREGGLVATSCYLPLSAAEGLPKQWGTRHRAALGLSERCDAWVLVVSEERGEVSLARDGKMIRVDNPAALLHLVREALSLKPSLKTSWKERIRSLFLDRWPVKLGTLALVSVIWLLLAGEQNFQVRVEVPLKAKDLPNRLEIIDPLGKTVTVTVEGLRKDASILTRDNVRAEIDLAKARPGTITYSLTREDIKLPNNRVRIVDIEPPRMTYTFREKPQYEGRLREITPGRPGNSIPTGVRGIKKAGWPVPSRILETSVEGDGWGRAVGDGSS
jgi:diadenylate cyclase